MHQGRASTSPPTIARTAAQALSHLASIGALAVLDRIPNPLILFKPGSREMVSTDQ